MRLRYTFILALAALATGLAAAGGWHYARASAPVNGPIILISIDTLRADHLPAYGYDKVKTPAIDALAADGTVFERAYSHVPQTLAAHASLLSGRLPFETGVRADVGFVLRDGERLLPQMLRERGYATGAVVSAYVLRRETGIAQGFHFFDDGWQDGDEASIITARGAPPPRALTRAFALARAAGAGPGQRDGAEAEAVAERWLDQQDPRLFLFLHLFEPHAPYEPPQQYAQYDPYDGEIAYADEIVGRLIQYVKAHQLYDRSTIVLLSDHGEGLGDHGEQGHGLFLYDEAIRVPLIIKQPAGVGAGRRIRDVVQHIDIVPTILDLANAPTPGNLRGRSLKPLLDGSGRVAEQSVYSEALYARYYFGWSRLAAITTGRYRYINGPREELYDLDGDPGERANRAGDLDQVRSEIMAVLNRLTSGAALNSPTINSGVELERLRELGYVWAYLGPETAAQVDPVDPKDRVELLETYRQAGRLAISGRLGSAVDLLRKAVAAHATAADAWQQLGDMLARAGRYEQAVRVFRRSAALTPQNPRAFLAAAALLLKLGRLDEAHREADAALEASADTQPRSRAEARILLVRAALARKDVDGARAHAAAGQEADPSVPLVAYVDGLVAFNHGQYEDALRHLSEAAARLNGKPSLLPELYFYTAEALARLERSDEAVLALRRELVQFPHNSRARATLATLYRSLGQLEAAERTVEELIKVAPTSEGYSLAARLWATFGEPRRAEALRSEARRLFRNDQKG